MVNDACMHLREWLQEIKGYLFPSGKEKNHPITRYRVYQIVSDLGNRLVPPYHLNHACMHSWFRFQREHYLVKFKGFSPFGVQAYLKLRNPPTIFGHREEWQNLLAIARPIRQEKFYEKAPFDALRDIQGLLKEAKNEVGIIDPYVDDSIFDLYLGYVPPNANIKLVTKHMYRKFREIAERFKVQKPNFEVRSADDIHDRYLIVDDRVWIMGTSLNRAGIKPFYIIEMVDKDRILKWFQRLWKYAKKELS